MTEPRQQHRPDPETLAAFAEGRLTGAARTEVIEHLDGCKDCMAELTVAMQMARSETPAAERAVAHRRWPALAAAAAAVAVAIAAWFWWSAARPGDPTLETLVAMAPRDARSVEPRLTGGFPWASHRGELRASGGEADPERMKLVGVAGAAVARARRDAGAEAQHAAGVALVLVQDPLAAIPYLEQAARMGNDPRSWSDLSAAKYAAAADRQRQSLYVEALAAADRALQLAPDLPEALFNRALILGRMRLPAQARRAWERYLEVDPSSPWAAEARAHLAALPAATAWSLFERERPHLERIAAAGDVEGVRPLVDRNPERARAFAETEYLGLWGEAHREGDAAEAARRLTMARTIGEALARGSGESLLRESVRAIDAATGPATRARLADAHARYRRARLQYARHELAPARTELLRAAQDLAAAGDPLELMARVYAAGARLATEDTAVAHAELERLLEEAVAHPHYLAFNAQTRWELGRGCLLDGDPSSAIPLLREAAALLHRARESARAAFVEALLARALAGAGRGDESWSAQIRAFGALSAAGAWNELRTSIAAAVGSELLAGRRDAALALVRVDDSGDRPDVRPADAVEALLQHALVASAEGIADEALAAARKAESIALRVPDPLVRGRLTADAALAAGAARSLREPAAAREALSRAIDYYRANELELLLAEALLFRARCALRAGDRASAARDLEEGIALAQAHGRDAPDDPGRLHAAAALFEEAIRLALDEGDGSRAFALAERARGGSIDAAGLQRRLAGSGTAVIAVAALSSELVTFAVTESAFRHERRPRARDATAALAKESLAERAPRAAAELYDDVIRPIAPLIAGARRLIVVADPLLATMPFGALYDRETGRHLVEQVPVAMAARATVLEPRRPGEAPPALAAFALASGAASGTRGLPAVADEVEQISRMYGPRAQVRTEGATFADVRAVRAAVLHIAGHTAAQPGTGEQALLFARGAEGVERIIWKDVAGAAPAAAEVVVLSACETLRPPASALTRVPSLGGAFSAAGVADVVGTLTPVADREAQSFFLDFHRELAAGADPAVALQRAQVAAIRNGAASWRAMALLTRRIPRPAARKETAVWGW